MPWCITRKRWRTRNCPCRKSAGPSRRAFFGRHHHDERIPGFEPGRAARPGHSARSWPSGVGLAALVMVDDLSPTVVSQSPKSAADSNATPVVELFCPPQESPTAGIATAKQLPQRTGGDRAGFDRSGARAVRSPARAGSQRNACARNVPRRKPALDEIKIFDGLPPDPLWLIISGRDEPEVYQRLSIAEAVLNDAVSNHVIGRYLPATALWPRAEQQAANRATAAVLGKQGPLLARSGVARRFQHQCPGSDRGTGADLAARRGQYGVVWPTNQVSQWLLKKFRGTHARRMAGDGLDLSGNQPG